jgi:hypothetical protein
VNPFHNEIYLAEYKLLKEEQRSRITVRDNLIYATFTALAAVVFFAFGRDPAHPAMLLLLPVVCLVFGWTYLSNDTKISDIGRYFRTELSPKMTNDTSVSMASLGESAPPDMKTIEIHMSDIKDFAPTSNTPLLGWEFFHRNGSDRRKSKFVQALVDLTVFCFVGLGALIVFAVLAPNTGPLFTLIACTELFALILFALELVRRTDFSKD